MLHQTVRLHHYTIKVYLNWQNVTIRFKMTSAKEAPYSHGEGVRFKQQLIISKVNIAVKSLPHKLHIQLD